MSPESIADEEGLFRRLPQLTVANDGTVTSLAYKLDGKPDHEISVFIARLTSPEDVQKPKPKQGVGLIVAAVPRSQGFVVTHDPDNDFYSHAVARGKNDRGKCRILAENTVVILAPKPVG